MGGYAVFHYRVEIQAFNEYAQDCMSIVVKENVSLKPHTVFKIGGPARFFVEVKSSQEFKEALGFAKEKAAPFFIAGAGSNILISDKGFDGVFIKNLANKIDIKGEEVFCESGAMMPYIAAEAAKAGLSGFEWGIGVPGTVGGSVRGNAGCYGGEMKDVVRSVEVFNSDTATSYRLQAINCGFSYRDSIFKKNPGLVVLSATLELKKGDETAIRARMRVLTERRGETQDIGAKCAGCIFKNVLWARRDINKREFLGRFPVFSRFENDSAISAGFLIDEAGLKGKKIGGAQISRKHANFFINSGGATAEDVVMLVAVAKEYVHRKFGILLEEEIQYVGF